MANFIGYKLGKVPQPGSIHFGLGQGSNKNEPRYQHAAAELRYIADVLDERS